MARDSVFTSTGIELDTFSDGSGVHSPTTVLRAVADGGEATDLKAGTGGALSTEARGKPVGSATIPGGERAVSGSASAEVIAANANRRYMLIVNIDGPETVWLSLGGTASEGNGIPLPVGGSWEMPTDAPFTGAINGRASAASTVTVIEY